jgi:hypothetical protein
MKPMLSHLKFTDWLLICVTLSVIGTFLIVLALRAYDIYLVGDLGRALSNPYFRIALLEQSAIILFLNLLANFLGAASLIAFFAIRRHIRKR